MFLFLVEIKLAIETVHQEHIGNDQQYKHIDRALLREPKAKRESSPWQVELIQPIHKENSAAKGHKRPYRQQASKVAEVMSPVLPTTFPVVLWQVVLWPVFLWPVFLWQVFVFQVAHECPAVCPSKLQSQEYTT